MRSFDMEITSAKYTESGSIIADIDGQRLAIPDDMGNRHRIALANWVDDGNVIEPYVEPSYVEPVPDEISRRQFFQHLASIEMITRADALAAIQTGAIPAPMQAIIDDLPDDDAKFEAMMLVAGATVFNRNNPLAELIRQAMQWTVEQKDDLWREAAKL